MAFKPGEYVGPYQVIEQLGQGGMATVYKAYHVSLDRYVALKVLHQAFNEDSTFISRFQREARVVAKLEHPNIVPVYDYAEHEGRPYLVMKFIEGDTLKARMSAGMLATDEIENVVDAVGAALSHAHQQGVLHRDIKPSNVMISKDNVIYLTDFGLARIAQDGESTMSSDSIMGTPQYISPEQAMGKKDLDGKTDIYSFGVMLYEMVVGQVPFSADTPFSIIHDHIYTPLPLPRSINANVPESVQKVLLKALAKNSLDRYETIGELISAFRHAWVEAGVPVRGTNITMRPNTLKASEVTSVTRTHSMGSVPPEQPAKRSAWLWASVGLVVILCFVLGLVVLRNRLSGNLSQGNENSPTLTPFVDVSTSTPFGQEPPQVSSPIPGEQMTPEIEKAMALVENNPGDSNAHLQLALAYWDAGMKVPCYEALTQAANLAGPNNKDFYLNAAGEFKTREAWIPTAGMYMRLAAVDRGESLSPEIKSNLREAVYRAASEEEMPLFVFFERIDGFDLPFGYVIRGRYALYNGSLEDARLHLANAEKLQPQLPEIHLLKAEIEIEAGNHKVANIILTTLSSDLNIPEWVRNMAGEILETIE